MTTPHIEAHIGAYHETVLMPGDPLRAKWIAENFLDKYEVVNTVRNCLGYSGTYKGKKVSVQASGMGQASLGIYAHELYNVYNVETIIRVGSCGGIAPDLKIGDIVVAMSAATDSAMTENLIPGFKLCPCCDYHLLKNYMKQNPILLLLVKWFPMIISINQILNGMKHLLVWECLVYVDMETHVLYSLAMRFGILKYQ